MSLLCKKLVLRLGVRWRIELPTRRLFIIFMVSDDNVEYFTDNSVTFLSISDECTQFTEIL